MANVVVAAGTVLVVLGSWAVYFGYTIVQVERGWATLIAGAVAASGGVVTVALGLILRRLTAMQAALRPRAAARAPATRADVEEPQLELGLVPPTSPPAERMIEPAQSPPSPHVDDLLDDVHLVQPALSPQPAAVSVAAEAPHAGVENAWAAVDAELQRIDWSTPPHAPDATREPPLAAAAVPHVPAEPQTHEDHPAPPEAETFALAATADHPPPPRVPDTEPSTRPAAVSEPEFKDDYGDLLGHPKAATPTIEAAAPASAAAAEAGDPHDAGSPHVVGKYEADGTTYTMFSDGSIEAQSPDGVYHFNSMAELKAFIEEAT